MPGYQAHLAAGGIAPAALLSGLAYSGLYRPPLPLALCLTAVCALAALFPDTDTASRGRKIFYTGATLLDVILILRHEYQWAALLGLCSMFPALGPHRGWTHTWWAMLLAPLPIIILPQFLYGTPWQRSLPFYLAALLGYFSHLALDREF